MIALLEPLHPDAEALLAAQAAIHHIDANEIGQSLNADEVDAILTRGLGRIDRGLIERCTNLRVVARCGVGLDNIDTIAAADHAVPVVYAPGSTTVAVAEHTILLALALARRVQPLANAVDAGNWGVRNGYSGIELSGKTLGLVGLGAIGQRVAELGIALGMHVLAWNRSVIETRIALVELDDLLRLSDVVSLHVALQEGTRGFIGQRELALMPRHALLINTARGALIDGLALRSALIDGRLGGFAADVLDQEPPARDDPLLSLENVLITPHVAALTDTTYRNLCMRTAHNVLAVLNGRPPEAASIFVQSR